MLKINFKYKLHLPTFIYIGRQDFTTCPHSNGADETAQYLVLHCPAYD